MVELAFHSLHYSPMLGGDRPLPEVVEAVAAAGFDAMGFDRPAIDAYQADGGTAAELSDLMARLGLRCSDVMVFTATHGLDTTREAAELAELAGMLGTKLCVAGVGDPEPWSDLRCIFRAAADVLWGHGVRLAVEFMPHSPLSSLEMAMRLCEAIGWERAGLVLDSFHFYQAETAIEELRTLEAAQIALVQCADAATLAPHDLKDESRNNRLVPGLGVLPLAEWSAAILDLGYQGPVAAEILAQDVRRGDPRQVATTIRQALARQWRTAVSL